MTARFSQFEPPAGVKQPELKEFQKTFRMIAEDKLPDGTYKQVIITPRGKITRIMDSAKDKVLSQKVQSFASDTTRKVEAGDFWEGPEEARKSQPQPRVEEFRKILTTKMLSEKQTPNKQWYQVWEGPNGRFVKILSPDKTKVLQQYTPARASLYKDIKKSKISRMKDLKAQVAPQPASEPIDVSNMNLGQIAAIIKSDWKNVYFGAVPYLDAMATLNSIKDNYYQDSGTSIVAYFLANANSWRGDVARVVKKELNKRLKAAGL